MKRHGDGGGTRGVGTGPILFKNQIPWQKKNAFDPEVLGHGILVHPADVPEPKLQPESVHLGRQRLHAMWEPGGIRDGQAVLVEELHVPGLLGRPAAVKHQRVVPRAVG